MNDKSSVEDNHRQKLRAKLGIREFLKSRNKILLPESRVNTEHFFHAGENAPLIIFLSGIGTYTELYAELLYGLSEVGFNVVGLDYPGHGYSEGKRGQYTVESVRKALTELLDLTEQSHSGPVYIFGYSIGSLLALDFAEHDERVQGIICGTLLVPEVAPDLLHLWGWQWVWGMSMWMPSYRMSLKTVVDYERLLKGNPAAVDINHDPLMIFDYPISTLSSLFTWKSRSLEEAYSFKGLILHGEKDEVLPLSYSEKLITQLKPSFELVTVPGGHMQPWDAPSLLIDHISKWVKST